ncbi:hypothetical protein [Nocardia brasiliensis]|uniref:hypothetical protein n=1 Tax=Nocardia brasiliensis TaxID=37326 RepID=UPI0024546DEB|nr:hypothetical protein [Nocardia brasiliensis]
MFRGKPNAIGFLRSDVSGVRQIWDETQIRSVAKRLGYDLCKILVFGADSERQMARLKATISQLDAESVIVPALAHFQGGQVPATLVRAVDVITVDPLKTFARCSDGTLPEDCA